MEVCDPWNEDYDHTSEKRLPVTHNTSEGKFLDLGSILLPLGQNLIERLQNMPIDSVMLIADYDKSLVSGYRMPLIFLLINFRQVESTCTKPPSCTVKKLSSQKEFYRYIC